MRDDEPQIESRDSTQSFIHQLLVTSKEDSLKMNQARIRPTVGRATDPHQGEAEAGEQLTPREGRTGPVQLGDNEAGDADRQFLGVT